MHVEEYIKLHEDKLTDNSNAVLLYLQLSINILDGFSNQIILSKNTVDFLGKLRSMIFCQLFRNFLMHNAKYAVSMKWLTAIEVA